MFSIKQITPILILVAAIVIPPMILPTLLASSAGLMLINHWREYAIGTLSNGEQGRDVMPSIMTPMKNLAQPQSSKSLYLLEKGIVHMDVINGKLVTRFTRYKSAVG